MKYIVLLLIVFMLAGCAYKSNTINIKNSHHVAVHRGTGDDSIPAEDVIDVLGRNANGISKLIPTGTSESNGFVQWFKKTILRQKPIESKGWTEQQNPSVALPEAQKDIELTNQQKLDALDEVINSE